MKEQAFFNCFIGILKREISRFLQQRARLISSLVRPLLWLIVFASGFRSTLGMAIIPPYTTYITYTTYIIPGLIGIILLFHSMQSSLSIVYDREMGSMKVLLTSPMPRGFLLLSKLFSSSLISVIQAYIFLCIAALFGFNVPFIGYLYLLPTILLSSMALGAIGLLLSSQIKQLENFAGVMNFVVFPMFFLSSALYPLWRMKESSEWLYYICLLNPFTYIVELIRFSLYSQLNITALLTTTLFGACFISISIWCYSSKSIR